MSGGLIQLVAIGSQDVHLTGEPQITFWKIVYKRHTNFAIESIPQTFSGNIDFGNTIVTTIARSGDLMSKSYLEVSLEMSEQNEATTALFGDNTMSESISLSRNTSTALSEPWMRYNIPIEQVKIRSLLDDEFIRLRDDMDRYQTNRSDPISRQPHFPGSPLLQATPAFAKIEAHHKTSFDKHHRPATDYGIVDRLLVV